MCFLAAGPLVRKKIATDVDVAFNKSAAVFEMHFMMTSSLCKHGR